VAEREQVEVTSRSGWRAWLAEHHASSPGVWAVTYKKASGGPHVPYEDVVEEALAFGWVDSLGRRLDDARWQLYCAPRKRGSAWSRANRARVERLAAAGLMAPAGQAAVDEAKASGAWLAIEHAEAGVEPDDLAAALDAEPDARRYWDAFPPSTKRGILEWIGTAKRPETRAKRVAETARLAAQDIRANQWRQPKGKRGA
jgi:uncharacterized protein YdeI (YjbR/CyaY-like superfamily)